MHLSVRLPQVEPPEIELPTPCPFPKCQGTHFKVHQVVCHKAVRDPKYAEVLLPRYRCLKCQRSFRVYPKGISHHHLSTRLEALSVLL